MATAGINDQGTQDPCCYCHEIETEVVVKTMTARVERYLIGTGQNSGETP